MGTKMADAFANIFMAAIATKIIGQSINKPLVWKDISRTYCHCGEIGLFIELANNYHLTITFTAEISETEITFLDIYIGYIYIG